MSVKENLTIVAGLLYMCGYSPYITAVVKGKTHPSKASWIIWASLDVILFATMFTANAVNGLIIGAVIGACIVAALALKRGEPGWTWLDKFCLGGAVLGILLWQTLKSPVVALVTTLLVAILGSIPTFISAWRDPTRENRTGWTIFWISCVCALCAVPRWTIADAAQPITFAAIESVMMYLLWLRPLQTPQTPLILLIQIPLPPKLPRDMVICQRCHRTFIEDDLEGIAKHTCASKQPQILH